MGSRNAKLEKNAKKFAEKKPQTYDEIAEICNNSYLRDPLGETYKVTVDNLNYNPVLDTHIIHRY